jgi:hypothetical protein
VGKMHNKIRIYFGIVAVFMLFILSVSTSVFALGHNNIFDRRDRMNTDVTNALNRARWSFKESDMEQRIRDWRERVNNTSNELMWRWCEGREDIQWMRERHWFFGNLSYENGLVAGKFIRFIFNEQNGNILAYTLKRDEGNITVFDSISLDNFKAKENPNVLYGSNWICRGENIILNAHDNPTAFLKINVIDGNNSLVFDLGNNFSANRTWSENVISINGESIRGKLIIVGPIWWRNNKTCNVSIEEGFINISLSERFSVFFMVNPIRGFGVGISNEFQDHIEDAISKCRVGARIYVQSANRTQNRTHSMLYSDINLRCRADKGRIEVNVSSEEEGGQTIVIDIDNETFNVININKIQVRYDGELIDKASNYSDILNPDDDNGKPEYLIVVGSDGIQILVSIPSFSEHVILISEIGASAGTEVGAPGFEFVLVFLAIIFILFIKRRRETL